MTASECASEPTTPPSLIETLRVEPGGSLPLLEGHIERLSRSCAALGYPLPEDAVIRKRVAQAIAGLETGQRWRLRLLLAPDGGLSLETHPLTTPPAPLKVIVDGPRLSGATHWLQYKTTHRPWYQQAAAWLADHPDIFEILYWNDVGEMCEGSRSNLYMQACDGRWQTPPLSSGALPGVQRQALLREGLVAEARITREDFLQARAWRISNALRGWLDVVIVEP